MEREKIRDFWEERATNTEFAENQVTHQDIWQRWLELELIKRLLNSTDRVLDIGCGNGFGTWQLAPLVQSILGIDFSPEMVRLAKSSRPQDSGRKPDFEVLDVLDLKPSSFGLFDTAITERCLINLPSVEDQEHAIANIAGVIRPGGRLIFIEGSIQGRQNLNRCRQAIGLEPMPPVWHNLDFDDARCLATLERFFVLESRLHFGVYDFISRVVHPMLVAPDQPAYESKINQVAARLALDLQEFPEISRVLFLVLRRNST